MAPRLGAIAAGLHRAPAATMIGAGVEEEPATFGPTTEPHALQLRRGEKLGDNLCEALEDAAQRLRPGGASPAIELAEGDDLALRRIAPQRLVDEGYVGALARLAKRPGQEQAVGRLAQYEGAAQQGG